MPLIPYEEAITTDNPAHDIAELVLAHRREKKLTSGQNAAGYIVYDQDRNRVAHSVGASLGRTDGTPGHFSSHPDQKCLSDIRAQLKCNNNQELRKKIADEKLEMVFFSERAPCTGCKSHIKDALGEDFIQRNTFYAVDYTLEKLRSGKSVMQNEFESELETVLTSERSPVHKKQRSSKTSDSEEDPNPRQTTIQPSVKSSSLPVPPAASETPKQRKPFLGFSAFARRQNQPIAISSPVAENEWLKTLRATYTYMASNGDQETISGKKISCAIGLHENPAIAQALSQIEAQGNPTIVLNAFAEHRSILTTSEYAAVLTSSFLVGEKVAQHFSKMHDLVANLEKASSISTQHFKP